LGKIVYPIYQLVIIGGWGGGGVKHLNSKTLVGNAHKVFSHNIEKLLTSYYKPKTF
jgi:hypothetical protein